MPEATPDPTPAEIEVRCLEVQAGWTDAQRLAKAIAPIAGWLPPFWPNVEDDAPERGWN